MEGTSVSIRIDVQGPLFLAIVLGDEPPFPALRFFLFAKPFRPVVQPARN